MGCITHLHSELQRLRVGYFVTLRYVPVDDRVHISLHYSAHASMEDKRRGMERLSFFTQEALPAVDEEPEREELRQMIDNMPLEKVRAMLQFAKNVN